MITNKSTFSSRGVTIQTADGSFTLVAGQNINIRPAGNSAIFSAVVPANQFNDNITPWQPPALPDASAPKNSVYFSTTGGKLSYKDSSGSVHALY